MKNCCQVEETKVWAAVHDFANLAISYCTWVDSSPPGNPRSVLEVYTLLARLQAAVLDLPEGDPSAPDPRDRNTSHHSAIRSRLRGLPVDHYWEVFDPLVEEEPVVVSLSDDLTDIYFDLHAGLTYYEQGDHSKAAWQWRFLFLAHWGEHLTGAQRVLWKYLSTSQAV